MRLKPLIRFNIPLWIPVHKTMRTLAALSVVVLFLPGAAIPAVSADQPRATKSAETPGPDAKWGIRVIGVRSTAAGHMLEFRYRVLDAEKAAALFERKTGAYLTHGKSGKVLAVPNTAKLGPLRNTNTPREGRNYWMFFGNTGRLVKVGDKVTVAIGDFRYEDLIVE